MNLQQIITFSTVVSEGSMTAAAEKLYLTQPAVSQQIRNLEEEMGVPLLDRGARHAKPTPQGQLLFEYAKRIISLTQQAQTAVQSMGAAVGGRLRVGTINSVGLQFISPVIGQFMKHNSKLSLVLNYDDPDYIMNALRKEELDVAILPDVDFTSVPKGIDAKPLLKDELLLVGSGREANLPEAVTSAELHGKPFVKMTERYAAIESQLEAVYSRAGVEPQVVFESNNVGTLKRVIEAGLGWGFLPAHSIRKQVRMGRLSVIEPAGDLKDLRLSFHIQYYSRAGAESSAIAELLYRSLRQAGLQS
jgi:DNA-binding transcriptional LysR family regulator